MKPHEIKFSNLITFLIFLAILIIVVLLLITGTNFEKAKEILTRLGIVSVVISLFWIYLNKSGWAHAPFHIFGWLVDIPDIWGRWVGEIDRDGENRPHSFILEVHQSLTHIQCHTYSRNNKSNGINCRILSDPTNKKFQLTFHWIGTGSKRGEVDSGHFHGYTILDLSETKESRRLEGFYFTNRSPKQTKGKIRLEWAGRQLKNSFQ